MEADRHGNAFEGSRNKCDIVSSLPLELVVEVVEYLDQADIVRCQMISKRWRSIFLSDTVINSVLPRTLAALDVKNMSVHVANAMTYIRWLLGLQFAHPVKKAFLPFQASAIKPREVHYNSRRLAYIVRDPNNQRDEVIMLDLETGKSSTWISGTDYIRNIWLFDRYLFMFSLQSVITVWDIHTSQKLGERKLWFPDYVTVAKDKAVIVPWVKRVPEAIRPIYIWDLGSDEVIKFGCFPDLHLCHVDADENLLITFEFNWDIHPPEVRQTKWTLTSGEQLHQKSFRLPVGSRRVDKAGFCRHPGENWIRSYSQKTVTQLYFDKMPHTIMQLTYDHAVDRLFLQWIDSVKPILVSTTSDLFTSLSPNIIYRWVKQLKGIMVYNTATRTAIVRPYHPDVRALNAHILHRAELQFPNSMAIADFWRLSPWRFCGDREVYCLVNDDGVHLWFFNPDFMPDIPDGVFSAMGGADR